MDPFPAVVPIAPLRAEKQTARLLMKHGDNVMRRNRDGITALDCALECSSG